MPRQNTDIRIPATRRELEAFNLTDVEMESFLKDGTTLEQAIRITRESRLLTRLKTDYPCGKCLKSLGEKQGFTWDRDLLVWVHRVCPNRKRRRKA